eukprot:s205_g22.t1
MKRLIFEAQTLVVADVKNKVTRKEDSVPANMAPAERENRIAEQRKRLTGLRLRGEEEVGHNVYDLLLAMAEKDVLVYHGPEKFHTRRQELLNQKPSKQLAIDASSLVVKDKASEITCSTNTELEVVNALRRRALAFDLTQLCPYDTMNAYHAELIDHLTQPAPPGYSAVSLHQVLRADRQAFMLLSERLTTLKKDAAGKTAIEKELMNVLSHSSVCFHLLPLAKGAGPKPVPKAKAGADTNRKRSRSRSPANVRQPSKGKGGGKGKGSKNKRGRGPNVPEPLINKALQTKDQKRICWAFNLPNGCSKAAPGAACDRVLLTRVTKANQLYQVTCDIIRFCHQRNKLWSVENPGRSFMWLTTPFIQLLSEIAPLEVSFHHCRYGSSRRKLTKFLHNIAHFAELEKMCDGSREHEPWGQNPDGSWATSLEVAYPWELCRAIASKVALELQTKGIQCSPPCFALQESTLQSLRASTEIQPRKGIPPMVSEFLEVIQHPVAEPLPPHSRRLSTPHSGGLSASASLVHDGETVTIGIHRTPEQFVADASRVGHPTLVSSMFPEEMKKVVEHTVFTSQRTLAQERTAELRRWALLAEELQHENLELLNTISERRRDILQGKRLVLMEKLLKDAKHQDGNLIADIVRGFDLTGRLPKAHVSKSKLRPASIPCDELRKIARVCRQAMLQTVSSSGDDELDRGLMAATLKEKSKGFLDGPIGLDTLPEGATLTRRFAVKQKNKVRPIDNYKASMVNSSVTQTEGVTVHTVDHIAAMVALWMRLSSSADGDRGLKAKCWDLSDAYKQLPLSDHAFTHDSFLVVYDPELRGPSIYQQKVLPFGSIASVTSFLRLSLAIWKLGTELLSITWSSYFDDFLSLGEDGVEKHTDMVISFLFSTLGWRLASEKLVDFNSVCKVLGVQLDLSEVRLGVAALANTQERVAELVADLEQVLLSGTLSRKDGERLRGRLQFASGQIFGRSMRNHLKIMSDHIQSGRKVMSSVTAEALRAIKAKVAENIPRRVSGRLSDHVHVYVDASFESTGYSGVGGVLYSSEGKCLGCFSEQVDASLMSLILKEGQETAIQELEALAVLVAVSCMQEILTGFRVVLFSDSESVRGAFLKAWSGNQNCSKVLLEIFRLEEEVQSQFWIERVPSQSNPADPLSRQEMSSFTGVARTRCDIKQLWQKLVQVRGVAATN